MARPRVLLADDNVVMAARIREMLEPAFDVVGVVNSGEELARAYETLDPEVVITDISMPGIGGLAAIKQIRDRHPGTRVVLLTVHDGPMMIRLGLGQGVQGYVIKEDAGDELIDAVHAVLEGRQYLSSTGRRSLG